MNTVWRINRKFVVALWYHGRIEIDTGEDMKRVKAWAVEAEDMFPNEINVFSKMKYEYITGIGTNEEESIQNALERFLERVDKGEYDFIQLGDSSWTEQILS